MTHHCQKEAQKAVKAFADEFEGLTDDVNPKAWRHIKQKDWLALRRKYGV